MCNIRGNKQLLILITSCLQSKTSQIVPEYTVELRGASVSRAARDKSSKKNVLEVRRSPCQLALWLLWLLWFPESSVASALKSSTLVWVLINHNFIIV